MAGVMYAADLGIGDFERMGIIGGSYGGYLVNWAVTQTDRFRAAVSMYGIFSLFTDWGTSVQPLWEKMYFGSYYWENTAAYVEHSPAFYAQHINTPVLILHGEDDELTFISNSKEMYQTLNSMGKTAEFVTYPREGHGLRSEPNHIIDKMDRIIAWFDKYVKPTVDEDLENEEPQPEPQ
jgi:dipeptidyl aminopeptidase/acylaminoacyl peptidase